MRNVFCALLFFVASAASAQEGRARAGGGASPAAVTSAVNGQAITPAQVTTTGDVNVAGDLNLTDTTAPNIVRSSASNATVTALTCATEEIPLADPSSGDCTWGAGTSGQVMILRVLTNGVAYTGDLTGSASSDNTARTHIATAGSGTNALSVGTEGARVGIGPDTYLSESGTTVVVSSGHSFSATSLINTGAVLEHQNANALLYLGSIDGVNTGRITTNIAAATAGATAAASMLKVYPQNALDATDWVLNIGTVGNAASVFAVAYNGAVTRPVTDQSADCDNAATGNAPVGKVCVQAGQGSMTLTNSLITTSSLVHLTNISDDTTCLSGYSTVGSGSVVIGCVGAATATANTVFAFQVTNQ